MTNDSADEPEQDDHVKVFVADDHGPEEYVGFFEEDGETGYLYVSGRSERAIVRHVQDVATQA